MPVGEFDRKPLASVDGFPTATSPSGSGTKAWVNLFPPARSRALPAIAVTSSKAALLRLWIDLRKCLTMLWNDVIVCCGCKPMLSFPGTFTFSLEDRPGLTTILPRGVPERSNPSTAQINTVNHRSSYPE